MYLFEGSIEIWVYKVKIDFFCFLECIQFILNVCAFPGFIHFQLRTQFERYFLSRINFQWCFNCLFLYFFFFLVRTAALILVNCFFCLYALTYLWSDYFLVFFAWLVLFWLIWEITLGLVISFVDKIFFWNLVFNLFNYSSFSSFIIYCCL